MTINLDSIVGSKVIAIDVVASGWTDGVWIFIGLDNFDITILSPWRYTINGVFQFGWIERRDYLTDLRESLIGTKVTLCNLSSYCDLKIEFQDRKVIEAFSVTKSIEQWTIVNHETKSFLENDGGAEINYSGDWMI